MQQCSRHDLYLGSQRGLMWSDAIRFLKLQTGAMQGRKLDHLKVIYWSSSKPHFSSVLLQWPLRQIFRTQAGEQRTKETRTHKQWNEKSRRTLETASSDKLIQTVGEIRLTGLTGHRWKKLGWGNKSEKWETRQAREAKTSGTCNGFNIFRVWNTLKMQRRENMN